MTEKSICPRCKIDMVAHTSRYGLFHSCPNYPACDMIGKLVGDTWIYSNQRTRDARKEAHNAFDSLWQCHLMQRDKAYDWLAEALGIRRDLCHIEQLDEAVCRRVVLLAANKFDKLNEETRL